MPIAPVNDMTHSDLIEYIEKLEDENQELRRKTNNRQKLSDVEVRQIRMMAEAGFTNTEIGMEFDINPETARRTVKRVYHADVS